jgi:hypothetical protein
VPAGLLPASAVCAVLRHALDALQWTVSEAGSELLQLLRCLRRVWVLLVGDEQLQVRAVQLQGSSTPGITYAGSAAGLTPTSCRAGGPWVKAYIPLLSCSCCQPRMRCFDLQGNNTYMNRS